MDTLDAHLASGRFSPRSPGLPSEIQSLVLDRYRLLALIGHGGFGTVWLARDERLGREVAIKRIARRAALSGSGSGFGPEDWDAGRRVLREAQAAGRLNHPGIVALLEAGEDDQAFYLVSELVRGRTLGELQSGLDRLSDADVAEVGAALCDALSHAHASGIVHRDVKPHNVMVPEDGRAPVPHAAKLTDFGVARIVGEDALTRTGDVVGTLAYMAPEQAEGREVSEASDLFSLALVVYEALSGANPLRGRGPAATARRVGARLPSLRRARRDLPPSLCQAIDNALSPSPRVRGTVEDLRCALVGALPELRDTPRHARAQARRSRQRANAPPAPPLDWPLPAPAGGAPEPAALADGAGPGPGRIPALPGRGPVPRGGRLAGALAGGALMAAALADLGPAPAVNPVLAGGVAALAIVLLPRLGWLGAAAFVVIWLAGAGQPGLGLLVGLGAAAIGTGLLRAPWLWSVPVLAPVFGVAGLAGAFPALAGQAGAPWRRAALGALGFWCLALAEAAIGRRLLLGPALGTAPRLRWQGSPVAAWSHALSPLLSDPMLAVAAVWALAAAVLPWFVRGRSAPMDIVLGAAWAGALMSATTWAVHLAGQALGGSGALASAPRGALLGPAAGAVAAVCARALRAARAQDPEPAVAPGPRP